MTSAQFLTALATLFVVVDPVALTPLFVALTPGATAAHRRVVALRANLIALGLMAAFALFGEALLTGIGISMPAFRIAGGTLLFFTAFDMLFERRTKRREDQHPDHHDPSVFPLATPLIAGPGALATMILLAGQHGSTVIGLLAVIGTAALVLALTLLMMMSAGLFERLLGRGGINVVTRLLGMLLAALSVQFILDGIRQTGLVAG